MPIDPIKLMLEVFESYFPAISNKDMAKALDVKIMTVWNYRNGNGPINNLKSARKVFAKVFNLAALKIVTPIYEFHPVTPHVRMKQDGKRFRGNKLYLFDRKEETKFAKLRSINDKPTKGIYVFYNSQREVVYVGKTQKGDRRTLLDEMNNQLNRIITLYGLNGGKTTRLRKIDLKQGEVVRYFSAYHIPFNNAIHNIEALLIRAYANDNTNFQMAQFKNSLR
jgi:hypothetical protein